MHPAGARCFAGCLYRQSRQTFTAICQSVGSEGACGASADTHTAAVAVKGTGLIGFKHLGNKYFRKENPGTVAGHNQTSVAPYESYAGLYGPPALQHRRRIHTDTTPCSPRAQKRFQNTSYGFMIISAIGITRYKWQRVVSQSIRQIRPSHTYHRLCPFKQSTRVYPQFRIIAHIAQFTGPSRAAPGLKTCPYLAGHPFRTGKPHSHCPGFEQR